MWIRCTVGAGDDRGVLARVTTGYRIVLSWASAYASLAWFGAIW